jgi:hypothetical protein
MTVTGGGARDGGADPRRRREPVYRITEVGEGASAELAGRQSRYLFSMGIRTACFVGAVAASGWLRWALLVGAILLPYVSVVLANAGRERSGTLPVSVLRRSRRALPVGTGAGERR